MLNFIRFNISKTRLSKATYITVGIFALLVGLFNTYEIISAPRTFEAYTEKYEEVKKREAEGQEESGAVVTIETTTTTNKLSEEEFLEADKGFVASHRTLTQYMGLITVTAFFTYILYGILISKDFSSGYLKNILAIRGSKLKWVASQFAVATVISLLIAGVTLAISFASELLTNAGIAPMDWTQLALFTLGFVLFNWLQVMIITVVMLLTQNRTTTIIIASLMASNLFQRLATYLGSIVNIDVEKLLFSTNLYEVGANFNANITPLLTTGIVQVLILFIVSIFIAYRIDYKFEH